MTDKDRVKFQNKIIEKLNDIAMARQEEYDNMVDYYEDELEGAEIALGMVQKQLNQMGYNEYSFAGAERKLN